jgi:methionyl-tRNA formyltransferase
LLRPLHGKSQAEANPMRDTAVARGTTVHDPESINEPHARAVLASYRPDLLVVCDYGQILAPETLEIARYGGINLHASLLPKYRGAAPINWGIYHGETETGGDHPHDAAIDAGPAIATAARRRRETRPSWRLASWARGADVGAEQWHGGDSPGSGAATRAARKKAGPSTGRDRRIIANQVRALQPCKKPTPSGAAAGEPLRLILTVSRRADGGDREMVLEAPAIARSSARGKKQLRSMDPAGRQAGAIGGRTSRGYSCQTGRRSLVLSPIHVKTNAVQNPLAVRPRAGLRWVSPGTSSDVRRV